MTAAIINLSQEALERWKKEHTELVEQLTIAALEDGQCGRALGHHPVTESAEHDVLEHMNQLRSK